GLRCGREGGVRAARGGERAGRLEGLARVGERSGLLRVLVLGRQRLRLRHLDAAELLPRVRVLLLQREVALERADRRGLVALRLVGAGEVEVALRRVLLDLVLRLRDLVAAAAEDAGVELVEPGARAGADAHADERGGEDDRESHVDPLLPPPQPREEELLVRIAAAAVPAPPPRAGLRRLCLRRLLLRLDRCPGHQPPRVAEAGAAFACRRSTSTASQIEPSKRIHIGRSSRNVVTGSGPGSASAIAAVMR